MAVTLGHLAKIEVEPLRKGILMNLLRNSDVMSVLPFENVNSLRSIAVRWTTLPTVSFRRINEGYTPDEGDTEQVWESVYGFGGEIKFDRVFGKIGNTIISPRQLQVNMKTEAMALTFNDYFINGDHASDEDGFEGLHKRIAGLPSRQRVQLGAASATAHDPTASAANARAFFDGLEEAHYKCNRGNVSAIFANEGVKWGLGKVARYAQITAGGGTLDMTKDSFDRSIVTYKGVPVFDVGLKTDQTTEIITNTQAAADAGADSTSIYFVSFNINQGIMGIQLSPVEIYDPLGGGEQESTPTKLIRLDWWLGLAGFGSYGATRMWNLEGTNLWT